MVDFTYKNLIRKALFSLDPEKAHDLAIFSLKIAGAISLFSHVLRKISSAPYREKNLLGIKFRNPLGLAAGFDKNAEVYQTLACLGFGFIEIGTVTLRPQPGNPRPRLFRIPEIFAVINRMGFNNIGARQVASNIERKGRPGVPLGINIGKNTDCPLDEAWKNYSDCLRILRYFGDYFVINISCPNVKDLTKLHEAKFLEKIIEECLAVEDKKPLFLKISPDLGPAELKTTVEICLKYKMGIIATNTTNSRAGLPEKWLNQAGGLSGKPLKKAANSKISAIRAISKDIPLIGVGGVFEKEDLDEKLKLGADLVQIYTSIIYEGPFIAKNLLSNPTSAVETKKALII